MAGFLKKTKAAKPGLKGGSKSLKPETDTATGPSPNAFTNMILATVALRGGGMLVRRGIEKALLGRRYSPEKAKSIIKGRTMTQALLGTAAARVATTSVPGAIIVGGGLLAKTLYDRHKGSAAAIKGEQEIQKQADSAPDTPES